MNSSLIPIQGVLVDAKAITALHHAFDPDRCGKNGCCCSHYEVELEDGELERLVNWQALAAEYQPNLRNEDQDFPFDEGEDGRWVIEADDENRCPFAYESEDGLTFCSIHSAALDRGENPYHIKPRSCSLWPLALSEDDPPILSVQPEVMNFPCNRKKEGNGLSPGVADLIAQVFGPDFRNALLTAIENS